MAPQVTVPIHVLPTSHAREALGRNFSGAEALLHSVVGPIDQSVFFLSKEEWCLVFLKKEMPGVDYQKVAEVNRRLLGEIFEEHDEMCSFGKGKGGRWCHWCRTRLSEKLGARGGKEINWSSFALLLRTDFQFSFLHKK